MLVGKAVDGQQGSPALPHVQRPPVQTPALVDELEFEQIDPSATQVPALQQPLEQVLPLQQGVPCVPQTAHSMLDEPEPHTEPTAQGSVPFVPGQQDSPGAPHPVQVPILHANPG